VPGLMGAGLSGRPHLEQDDLQPSLSCLPRGLAARQAPSDYDHRWR